MRMLTCDGKVLVSVGWPSWHNRVVFEVRRDSWWARCWRNEELPQPRLAGDTPTRVLDVPSYSKVRSVAGSFAVERWHHRGGKADYALVGFEFEPAGIGQLVVQAMDIKSDEWREAVLAALRSVRFSLEHELGPGRLTLATLRCDDVDTSVASLATTACAAAQLAARPADEVQRDADRLLLRPCQFEGEVWSVFHLPDGLADRAGVPGVILGGPWLKGDARVGDEVEIRHADGVARAMIRSFPSIRFGGHEPTWQAIELDIDGAINFPLPATVKGFPHWRPSTESQDS